MIEVIQVAKSYRSPAGERMPVLCGVSLRIERGELVALLGPSGCGKTTLLNVAAGFETPDTGEIRIAGQRVRGPSPRRITVFQQGGLLPWRTVQQNIELGLERKRLSRQKRQAIAEAYMQRVGLLAFRRHHPHQLSGGMQQRVAIARALVVQPEAMFMDEPFGALDAMTRRAMQQELQNLRREQACTIVLVTHDIDEAVLLADRVVVLSHRPGRILAEVAPGRNLDRTHGTADFIAARLAVGRAIAPWQLNPDFSI